MESITPHRKSIEIRSYHDDQHYNILMSAHSDVIANLPLPFCDHFEHVIQESLEGYMPVKVGLSSLVCLWTIILVSTADCLD